MTTNVIFKYKLEYPSTDLMLPRHSLPLSVGEQNGDVILWVQQQPDTTVVEKRRFIIRMTGHRFNAKLSDLFLGTIQIRRAGEPEFVAHVFEVGL